MLTPEQLAARYGKIGGSDAACVCGMDEYKQPLELYMEMRGEWPRPRLDDHPPVHFGNQLEDFIAAEWSRRTERKIRRDKRSLLHPDLDWMVGHIDRRISGADEGLECKNHGFRVAGGYGPSGGDEVPERDIIQVHHYMAITGWNTWHLAAYFGGADFRTYRIFRDQGLIDSIISIECDFIERVRKGRQPDLVLEHRSAGEMLKRLYPGTNGKMMILPEEAKAWHRVAEEAASLRKAYADAEEGAKLHLRRMMGEASIGLLPDGSGAGYTRKTVKRPEYAVAATAYLDFRFSKKPKGVK